MSKKVGLYVNIDYEAKDGTNRSMRASGTVTVDEAIEKVKKLAEALEREKEIIK